MVATPRSTPGMLDRSRAFRERARLEADRYGPDPWIFVRELLQNSRDAGAQTVSFLVSDDGPTEQVRCVDDGEGMTFEHARRYLFSLYASSKEGNKRQAGKFGVGFWSILRFEPSSITIRSRPRYGEAWGLTLDGGLEHATAAAPPEQIGTEIILHRPRRDGRLEHRVYDAVWQSARYLRTRDDTERALTMTINGRSANAEFALAAPSASFRRRTVRGVVGLGPAPRVELFSRGLRVRSAACLDDLVAATGRHTSRMRVQFPELPGGLAPQALLESDGLEIMLSRSDARDTRTLRRLVRLAQAELERLIDRQLAFARPQPWWRRGGGWLAARLRESLAARTAVGATIGVVLAVVTSWWLWGDTEDPTGPPVPAVVVPGPSATPNPVAVAAPATAPLAKPYRDLGTRYRGPKVDVLSPGAAEPVKIQYAPPEAKLHFAALTSDRLAEDGSPIHQPIPDRLRPYRGTQCEDGCIEVALVVDADRGIMRIPVPTGHRVVAKSTSLDGKPLDVGASAEGHPSIEVTSAVQGVLRYFTSPAADRPVRVSRARSPLPPDLLGKARAERPTSVDHRVDALLTLVQERVAYDRSQGTADRHQAAQTGGVGFIDRTLEIGAGDCDVQNGLLVALLHAADVPARLAVGYLGSDGGVLPWLHAWVEYQDEDGVWRIADASESGAAVPSLPPVVASAEPGPSVAAGSPPGPSDTPAADGTAIGAGTTPVTPAPAPVAKAPDPARAQPWWLLATIPLIAVVAAVSGIIGGRTRRAFKLDHSADLSRLLQGVLQQPGAFGHMPAVFHRPLVPLLDGTAVSLHRARDLAARSRLYRTRQGSGLAQRASRAGAAVLDDRTPEGRTVADALGAADLDRWSVLVESSFTDPLIEAINEVVAIRGEDWMIRIADGMTESLTSIDLSPLGTRLKGIDATRLVLVDRSAPWLRRASSLMTSRPRAAVFAALDEIAERMNLPENRRSILLAEGARAALLESFTA